jgi:hypothetical protein
MANAAADVGAHLSDGTGGVTGRRLKRVAKTRPERPIASRETTNTSTILTMNTRPNARP